MKIYTHYSESHKVMYDDFFKSSLRSLYSKEQATIRGCFHRQTTSSGYFMTDGWLDAMEIKLDVILNAINENKNNWFIFADCDIQFFKPFIDDLEKELIDYDIVCQNDRDTLCAGFFACRSNDATLNLFQNVKRHFRSLVNDQIALNRFKNEVRYKLLDTEKYFTIGNIFNNVDGTHNWDNITPITPPVNILIHHANYVKGVDNKLKLLADIKSKIKNI